MNEYIPALNPVEFQLSPDSIIKQRLSENLDLCFAQVLLHTVKAKLRDYHTHNRRQITRLSTAGFFMPVESNTGGLTSGMRGLQDGVSRNKRVVRFRLNDDSTRQFLPTIRINIGSTIMNAIALSAPAFLLRKQQPSAPASLPSSGTLVFAHTPTGITLSKDGVLVAWVVQGHHQGQIDKHPHKVEFVDVAYHRQTQRGINLETADFANLPEALGFLCDVFGLKAEGGAV